MKNINYLQVRNVIDDLFCLIDRRLGLKSGDISPLQEQKLNNAVIAISEVIKEWKEQNK